MRLRKQLRKKTELHSISFTFVDAVSIPNSTGRISPRLTHLLVVILMKVHGYERLPVGKPSSKWMTACRIIIPTHYCSVA